MFEFKRIVMSNRSKKKALHIEVPGGVINITIGLTNENGQAVTHISVAADGSRYAGEPEWWVERHGLIDKLGVGVRLVQSVKE